MGYFGAFCGVISIIWLIIFFSQLVSKSRDYKLMAMAGMGFLLMMYITVNIGIWYNQINTAGISESTVDLVTEYTSENKRTIGIIMSKCADAEMDLYDTLYIIDPTLTDEQRMSIVILNDKILNDKIMEKEAD